MTDPTLLQADLFGLTIGSGTSYGWYAHYGFFGSPEADPVGADNGFNPGSVFSHTQLKAREFGFTVEVGSESDRNTLRSYAASALNGGQTFRFTVTGTTVERLTEVSLLSVDPVEGDELEMSAGLWRYALRFRAADPIVYTDTASVLNLNTAGTTSGTVTNAGDYGPVHLPGLWSCVITAGGSGCTGPKLVNGHASLSGGPNTIDLHDVSLTAGQTVTVTASSEQVYKSSTNVYGSCRGASAGTLPEFFPLLPGAQTVTLSCLTGACTAAFTYRSARL